MIKVNIDVTKIVKGELFKGRKGTYLTLTLIENKDGKDQYDNDGFAVQEISEARRKNGEKGQILGNYRVIEPVAKKAPATAPRGYQKPEPSHNEDEDEIPF